MESQDNHHPPPEHAPQEIGPAGREEYTPAALTSVAILKRLRLGRPSLLPEMDEMQLLAALSSADWQIRVAAVQKLEECGDHAPIEHLIRALKDEHEAVRAAAAHALGVLGNPKAIAPLVDALHDMIWLVRAAVVQAIGMLGEYAPVEPLMLALHDEDESVRTVAVRALGTMGERVSMECLLAALQDSVWQVREMALLALGARGEHIPRAALMAALQDEDESVRRAAHFLQEMYPDRFAETPAGLPTTVSEESREHAFAPLLVAFLQRASNIDQQEERSKELLSLDNERGLQHAAQHRSLQRYPRRGTLHILRLALLVCWSLFLGYLVSIIWKLVQLTHANLAQLTARVAVQTISAPLTALAGFNVPVWVRGVCILLALLLFFGCLWAARDMWYEHEWAHRRGVRREELAVGSGNHNQFTPASVNPSQQIPAARLLSRRAVLVGLTTVLIVGNSIAWSLLLNRKRRTQVSSGLALGKILYTYRGHTSAVRSVSWSSEGTRIASGSDDKTVQVWNATNGDNSFAYHGHPFAVLTVAWSPDGRRIASADYDGAVEVWDASTGRNVFTYRGHTGNAVTAVAWSPDGKRIASTSADGTVQVWDATNGGNGYTYRGHYQVVYAVAWSPDGKRIASGSWDSTVQVWDSMTGSNVFTCRGHENGVSAVAWSPDGKYIVSGSQDKTVQVWDATSGGHIYTYLGHYNASLGFITAVAWSPHSRRIASGSWDNTVQVWDAVDGDNSFIYRGHTDAVTTVAWSPDGKYIASGSQDKTVQVWDAG